MAEADGNLPLGGEKEVDEEPNDVVDEARSTASSSSAAAAFLGELNLVMMVAFLTLSGDDLSSLDEEPEKVVAAEEHHVRELASKLQRRRNRQTDAFKAADRQSFARSQHKILDSRHGRKM